MSKGNLFVYVATYDSEGAAADDYDTLAALHMEGLVGSYDAAILTRDEDGKVHVHKEEKPTQHGAWLGGAVGAVVGILFPPSILAGLVVGGATGALVGHFWGGMSRSDLKDLGEALDEGESAIIIVAESEIQHIVSNQIKRANKQLEKEIRKDSRALKKLIEQLDAQQAGEGAGARPH